MTGRELISEIAKKKSQLETYDVKIEALRTLAEKSTSAVGPGTGRSTSGAKDDVYAKLIDLEREMYKIEAEYTKLTMELIEKITDSCSETTAKAMLYRYVYGMPQIEIAEELDLSERYVYQLLRVGRNAIDE